MAAIAAKEKLQTFPDADKNHDEEERLEDEYIANFKLDNHVHVILSELKIILLHREKIIRVHYWSEISHCYFSPDHVGVVMYSSTLKTNPVKIYYKTRDRGIQLYKGLCLHSYLMGNPPGTLPLEHAEEEVSGDVSHSHIPREKSGSRNAPNPQASSTSSLLPSSRYVFGTAKVAVADLKFCSEKQLMIETNARLANMTHDGDDDSQTEEARFYARLDEAATWLVHSYLKSCNKFSLTRCCVVIVLNASSRSVSLLEVTMVKGRKIYNSNTTSSIEPNNGHAIFLGCGAPPSFYESGVVEMSLSTSAFDAVLSTDAKRAVISEGKRGDGRRVGFVEKTSKEWWSKYCILVT
mmetsp:Transcript_1548/g.2909  ORF Transcript_1548/g.2909 Transcript_1548/m.2909 type:complete len:351 (+) Transcript_1548:3407-4459(+)